MRSITSAQNDKANIAAIDLLGESSKVFKEVKLNRIEQSVEYLGMLYAKKLVDNLQEHNSSGNLADNITSTEVEVNGTICSVAIMAPDYADYINEGVNGWANDRGSRFNFKTKGVKEGSDMFNSIKDYLEREGKIKANTKVAVTDREVKRENIKDATTRQTLTVMYMIKRMGIEPTRFWDMARLEMQKEVEEELKAALEIDMINSFRLL